MNNNIVIPKKSSVPGKIPTVEDLEIGEFAVNLKDKRIYTRDAEDNIVCIGDGVLDGFKWTAGETAPTNPPPKSGDKWFRTVNGIEYTFLKMGENPGQWVDLSSLIISNDPPVIGSTDVGAEIHIATEKDIPVDDDEIAISDSEASWALKKLKLSNLKDAIYAGFPGRNKIINGKMDIVQRGTSFPAIASGTYTLDRWAWTFTNSSVVTVSQQADVPAGNEFQNSLRIAVTTADAAVAAGDEAKLRQVIEGFNARDLIGRSFTLSFRARSSKTGVHCVALKNFGADRTYVAEYTINAANTWEPKSITVPAGLITAGTWNWTNGAGLFVDFALMSGTNFQTTAGAWQTGNFVATANQVNCLDTIGNIFAITGVQLEVGSVATPFEHRPYGLELVLCQRYLPAYQSVGVTDFIGAGQAVSTTQVSLVYQHKVLPRVAPTGAVFSSPGHFTLNDVPAAVTATGATFSSGGLHGTRILLTQTGLTAGRAVEVYGNTASARILFTGCEL